MKSQLALFSLLILLVLGFGVMFYVGFLEVKRRDRLIHDLVVGKDDMMSRDSLNQVMFNQILDSVRIVIRSQRDHAQRLENFNRQIRNQNDELRKIYKALPDSGRPEY